jgi:ribosomal protein S12 methylthiotransferase
MSSQLEISARKLMSMLNRPLPVLIEAAPEPGIFEGRNRVQAPEVDGLTFVRTDPQAPQPRVGDIVTVKITETLEYDLVGELV